VKRCRKCGGDKPLSEFYRQKGRRDGYRNDCKACFSARSKQWYLRNREHAIAQVQAWQRANPERVKATRKAARSRRRPIDRDARLRRVFGLSSEQYEAMLAEQGGGCALCRRTPPPGRSLHVDHHHESGVVRGLLCFSCNAAMGQLREDKLLIADSIVYLARGRRALDCDRSSRESVVDLICEPFGASLTFFDLTTGSGGASPTGVEVASE